MALTIVLPSNNYSYQNNTIGHYITHLAQRLEFEQGDQVALAEITYTNSWHNLKTDQKIYMTTDSKTTCLKNAAVLPAGRYENIHELTRLITKIVDENKIDEVKTVPKFTVHSNSRRLYVTLGETKSGSKITLKFDQQLSEMLGFKAIYKRNRSDKDRYKVNNSKTDSVVVVENLKESSKSKLKIYDDGYMTKQPYDLNVGTYSLFVYTDIVKHSFVGDSSSQLLRTVAIPRSNFGDQIVLTYTDPLFIDLQEHDVQSIEISIKDDTGSDVLFNFGKTSVTLLFKRQDGRILY